MGEFEIVDQYGARWRYKRAEGYSWQWRIDPTNHQRELRDCVEVKLNDDPDFEPRIVMEYPHPAAVGDVTPNTCLNFNLRERAAAAKNRVVVGYSKPPCTSCYATTSAVCSPPDHPRRGSHA